MPTTYHLTPVITLSRLAWHTCDLPRAFYSHIFILLLCGNSDPLEAFAPYHHTVVVQFSLNVRILAPLQSLSYSACASTCHPNAGAPPPYPSHTSIRLTLYAGRSC